MAGRVRRLANRYDIATIGAIPARNGPIKNRHCLYCRASRSVGFHPRRPAMPPSPLRLYVDAQFTSPYAMSVFVTLREKGLAFDTLTLDLDAAHNQATDYAQLSLTQRVPTLVEGDFALSESSA